MDTDIIFRKAVYKDKNQVSDVLLDFYNIENFNEAKNVFKMELEKDYHYIVAIRKQKIIGLVTWVMHGLPKHGLFELDRICLLSESRGRGIGKQLINALIKDARVWYESHKSSIRKLYILTHDENINAQAFYEAVGFQHETTLKNHYYNDKHERVYTKFFHNP